MSKEKQIEGYLTTKLKPKNKIDCVAWLLLNVFGCKFCKACRDKPCNIKDGETCTNNIANYIREAVKEEAGYRKQSENTIELPCKVGQTVYMPWEWNDTSGIAILTVERISITEAGQSIRTDLWSDDEDYWLAYNCGVYEFDDIGKTVFLTKEEAEQTLAKMKGGAE